MLLLLRGSNAGHDATRRASLFSRSKHTALPVGLPTSGHVVMALLTQNPSCHLPLSLSHIAPGKGPPPTLDETQELLEVAGGRQHLPLVCSLASLSGCLPPQRLFTL